MDSYIVECKQKILQHAKALMGEAEVLRCSVGSVEQMISDVDQAHLDFVEELEQSFEEVKVTLERRKKELMEESEDIRLLKISKLERQKKAVKAYAEQLEKTSLAFEAKSNSLKSIDEVSSVNTFEYVAKEMKAKVPNLAPCCSEALDKDANLSELICMINASGKVSNMDTNATMRAFWMTSAYVFGALVVLLTGFILCPNNGTRVMPSCMNNDHQNGIINWIGTNEGRKEFINPAITQQVKVHYSSIDRASDNVYTLTSKKRGYCMTRNTPESWFSFDFQHYQVRPLRYSITHGGYKNVLRNWELQGSNDQQVWSTLKSHINDTTIATGSVCASGIWSVKDPKAFYRYIRVLQTGLNSGNTNILSLGNMELYGYVRRSEL